MLRKPKIGDEWQLTWLSNKPVRRIASFSRIWLKWNKPVPGVWFEGATKVKNCSVRQLLKHGVLVKPVSKE